MCTAVSLVFLWICIVDVVFFFFKQKTTDELRISDWSSDVCSSDLAVGGDAGPLALDQRLERRGLRGQIGVDRRHGLLRPPMGGFQAVQHVDQIGRAWCRESVCVYV